VFEASAILRPQWRRQSSNELEIIAVAGLQFLIETVFALLKILEIRNSWKIMQRED
jgi:hypothetical protein